MIKEQFQFYLRLGLDEFSMSASNVLATRELINSLEHKKMQKLAEKALNLHTMLDVEEMLKKEL
ncbi:hypothetical protein ONA24_06090 [Mycoplasmopsis cynos]|nr:hypothetical protein [Mycoplasmopsis cynos]WAM09536.1 hypothetical protein ONA24_06090 [Mycoplasmopsis cynos]